MTKKKINNCNNCKYFGNEKCNHISNIGIKIAFRNEEEFRLLPYYEKNKDGDCEHYAEI